MSTAFVAIPRTTTNDRISGLHRTPAKIPRSKNGLKKLKMQLTFRTKGVGMPYRYLPMLRSKAGEATALTHLTPYAKNRMMPVIHLVHVPPATFGAAVGQAWSGNPMGLDGTFQTNNTGSTTSFTQMFNLIGRSRVSLIPSIECNTIAPYLIAVQQLRGRYAPGLIVKAKLNQLNFVQTWVTSQGWSFNEVDLIVTLGEIGGFDPTTLVPAVVTTMQAHIPNPSPWRSITLSSSAAPQDHTGLAAGRNDVPRLEWRVWRDVVAARLPFQVEYADYSTITPDLTDPPGYVMSRATVSARYTIDNDWIILKGRPTTGRAGQPMRQQYQAHATAFAADPNFGGLVGCWADGRIRQIAAGTLSPGSRSQWASYSANRHLSFIADRLP
jgi:Beta protein